jgi:hypothetical protein
VNLNMLTGPQGLDRPSGNAALNGVPVRLEPIRTPVAAGD